MRRSSGRRRCGPGDDPCAHLRYLLPHLIGIMHIIAYCVICLFALTRHLCCAVLCCAVLCCAVLCCAVLCCAVLCCAVLCCAVLCCLYWLGYTIARAQAELEAAVSAVADATSVVEGLLD